MCGGVFAELTFVPRRGENRAASNDQRPYRNVFVFQSRSSLFEGEVHEPGIRGRIGQVFSRRDRSFFLAWLYFSLNQSSASFAQSYSVARIAKPPIVIKNDQGPGS